jgi:hypothetical protein
MRAPVSGLTFRCDESRWNNIAWMHASACETLSGDSQQDTEKVHAYQKSKHHAFTLLKFEGDDVLSESIVAS